MTYTHDELWEAQLHFYPGSVELSPATMLMWAREPCDEREVHHRFRAIAFTIQHPSGVFYRTKSGDIGFRFGIEGNHYQSNFTW